MKVWVNGTEAVCQNADCEYMYVDTNMTITAFSFDSATKEVTFSGDNLPTNVSDIENLVFA